MKLPSLFLVVATTNIVSSYTSSFVRIPFKCTKSKLFSQPFSSEEGGTPEPKNFREAEIFGLRLMQEGEYELALKAFEKSFKLPGSRTDIIRTKLVSGPSPVGGSSGGTEGKKIYELDEFEYQAVHYNMACAHSKLGNTAESIKNLESAFRYGFDNYTTVRTDPDLAQIQNSREFENLMMTYDPKNGFLNPFSFFGSKE